MLHKLTIRPLIAEFEIKKLHLKTVNFSKACSMNLDLFLIIIHFRVYPKGFMSRKMAASQAAKY